MGQTHKQTEKRLYLSFHQSLALQSNCCFKLIIYYSEIYRTSASQIKKNMNDLLYTKNLSPIQRTADISEPISTILTLV